MTTCSLDIVKELFPSYLKSFRSVLARNNLLEEVIGSEGNGLTLTEYHETLANTFPDSVIVECIEAVHYINSRELFNSINMIIDEVTVVINYLEPGETEGHYAVVTAVDLKLNTITLYNPGYPAKERWQVLSAATFWPLFRAKDRVSKQHRGVILIQETMTEDNSCGVL